MRPRVCGCFCVLGALLLALPAAAANLAEQAAYQVTLAGYVYPGQVIPGTNTPATVQSFLPAPPWQGPAQALTDGRRDGDVVRSWFWSQMDKRITVRFDLRRAAQVTALRVWPQAGTPPFDDATARLSPTPEGLTQAPLVKLQAAGEGMAWTGPATACRYVEITCASGQPQMSLAELEIVGEAAGEVAADAPPPGLIPVAPRDLGPLVQLPQLPPEAVNLARQPGVKLTVTSRHYDDKRGALVEDGAAAASDPSGQALRDGHREGPVRSFAGWYAAKRIQAEFRLAAPSRVDRIVVWSAGHGAGRSFINSVKVWLQAGEGAVWVPADETWNPLRPAEVPAAQYPLITSALGKPATAVRVELGGVAQSADYMQVGEIEIWGQATGQPLAAQPWRVKAPVPEITPVAAGPLDPAYDWLRTERLRGMYGYVGQWQNEDLLGRITGAGFNCFIVHTMGASHQEAGWPAEVREWVKVERERKLRVIISWPYGSDERYGNTRFGAYQPGGAAVWKRGPCPLSREYWDRVVGDRAVIAAQAGLTGLVVDMEMYAADATRFPGPCYCNTCWGCFVNEHLEGVTAEDVPLADRPAWTAANQLGSDYARWQELQVMALLQAIRDRVREVNPRFLLGNLLDAESLPGLARGFGTPTMPALVFSEVEYGGQTAGLTARLEQLRRRGYPVWYLPGLWIKPVTPPQLPELVRTVAPPSGGYWIWSDAAFAPNVRPEYAHAEGYSHEDYWQAFRRAHEALDTALRAGAPGPAGPQATGPRATVPRIKGPEPTATDWAQALVLSSFKHYRSAEPAQAATEVRVLWEGTRLHLRVRCEEPEMGKLVLKDAARDDGDLWQQDSLEVFWMRPGAEAYAHVVVNAAGVLADAFSDGIRPEDPGWDADVKVQTTRGEGHWEMNLALPLAADGGGPIAPGTEMRLEIVRNRRGSGETTCWAPTGGMFRGAPELWGTLVLR